MSWTASVLTILPAMFPGPLDASLVGRARAQVAWALDTIDIRDFATGKHRSVDDTPAGGGPGMVMRADVLASAIDAAAAQAPKGRPVIAMTPRGKKLTQARVRELAKGAGVIVLCGRFEGMDERLFARRKIEEISLGDFVLAGGEIAAMALIEACVRLMPGVIGDQASTQEESFEQGLLEYPHYTRPQAFEGLEIPAVLTSGHHAEIAKWRRAQAEAITRERRPDLWAAYCAKAKTHS